MNRFWIPDGKVKSREGRGGNQEEGHQLEDIMEDGSLDQDGGRDKDIKGSGMDVIARKLGG